MDFLNKMMENKYDVSIIVVTYNPIWEKLKITLAAILLQKDVDIEIIISDDGSIDNMFKKIKQLFMEKNFLNYKLLPSSENQGTVKNFLKGLKIAQGKYIKGISPGDLFYDELTLKKWLSFMKQKQALVSFGEYIPYKFINNKLKPLKILHHPIYMKPYLDNKYNIKQEQLMYVFLGDNAVGATFMSEKVITEKYLDYICNNVKFAEDNIFKSMIADGILIDYYPQNVIWYEYGTGVSTSQNLFWHKAILKDRVNFSKLIYNQLLKKSNKNIILKKYMKLIHYGINSNNRNKIYRFIFKLKKLYFILKIPKGLIYYMNLHLKKTYTSINVDETFYWKSKNYK